MLTYAQHNNTAIRVGLGCRLAKNRGQFAFAITAAANTNSIDDVSRNRLKSSIESRLNIESFLCLI